jgi:glutamyl-Q tRNA(Asp) synthetase
VPDKPGNTTTLGKAGLTDYVGRFAPSPTGPLHFGSLVAAVASYLDARTSNGHWLLRMENIDPPREVPGAADEILRALEAYGLQWDGAVAYQADNERRHREVIAGLLDRGLAYPCNCSRSSLVDAPVGESGPIYPGTCRSGCDAGDHAIRLLTNDDPISFSDELQGVRVQRIESEVGDFVIRRKDGLIAYQLAVVVDDFDQGITHVVRGYDLIDSTPRQIYLQRCLGMPSPRYKHTPLVLARDGQKLSKSTGAQGISRDRVPAVLAQALRALRQDPPKELGDAALDDIWEWAFSNWRTHRLAGEKQTLPFEDAIAKHKNGLS